jgi:hypothetical protein
MAEIGVVHLVRRKNGIAPFERFLGSYRQHSAGVPHDLVLIFKGFASSGTPDYDRLLAGMPHRRIYLSDYGFDLRPYFKAVEMLEHRYLCFFNSYSRILDGDWLAKLYRWAAAEGVGVAGATASCQSFSTNTAERERMLRGLSGGARLRWRLGHIFADRQPQLIAQRAAAWPLGAIGLWDPARYFPPFPNYHVRTNGFMAARETLARVRTGLLLFKLSAYYFESGREGLTGQIMQLGLRPLMVGRDGVGYEKEQWHVANTFWQGKQENLLVADNRTEQYAASDAAGRAELSRYAWGADARPA